MSRYLNQLNLLVLFVSFLMVFYIAYLTPFQADDYDYYFKGLSLEKHIDHYLHWSGRFVADYISSAILILANNYVKSSILSISTISMLFCISILPSILYKSNYRIYNFIFIFILFWVTNPALGETVFWVVGAANYLFTNLFVGIYLFFLCLYVVGKKNIFYPFMLFSFLAGLSNENTSVIVFLISIGSSLYVFIHKEDKKIFLSTIILSAGLLILILSPGNFERALHPSFASWRQMSLIGRAAFFLTGSFLRALLHTSLLLVTTGILLNKSYKIEELPKKQKAIPLVFLFASLLSIFSMVSAPCFPQRAMAGPCLFMIVSCSFSFDAIMNSSLAKVKRFNHFIFSLYALLFVCSYTLMFYSSKRVHIQEKIRLLTIQENLSKGYKSFTLPNFYWPRSFKKSDSINNSYISENIGKYYNLSNISVFEPYFDYSILLEGKLINKSLRLSDRLKIKSIYLGKDKFLKGSSIALILEANPELTQVHLIVNIIDKKGKIHQIKPNKNSAYNVNTLMNHKLIGFTSTVNPDDIKTIVINNYSINNI